jgi:crotonobetainyl-CoA:carnitine CoA-transferase CaiB-like acyl-CoA transferase
MKPLEGVTILEFSTMITASFAAMMMGEQGARVIKVEPVDMGDPMRYIGTAKGGISGIFANCNRGKQSVRIDLKAEEGQALVREMAAQVDVVIHNFRPGVMEKLNLGGDQLRSINPRLIHMAISGFGKEGPLSAAPAYDPVIQAHAGMTASQGRGEPAFIRNLMCDKITAYTACQAVTGALYQREKTGEGQQIDLSMLDAGLFFLFPDAFMNHTLLDEDAAFQPLLADLLYELTITSDGGITISAGNERQRQGVMRALELESLMEDERFATMDALVANIDAYRDIMAEAFSELTTEEAMQRLKDQDVPCARCHSMEEVLDQPQLEANGSLSTQQHPLMGNIRIMKAPARFGGELQTPGGPAPDHGQDTDAVLGAMGVDESRVQSLKDAGVIA